MDDSIDMIFPKMCIVVTIQNALFIKFINIVVITRKEYFSMYTIRPSLWGNDRKAKSQSLIFSQETFIISGKIDLVKMS